MLKYLWQCKEMSSDFRASSMARNSSENTEKNANRRKLKTVFLQAIPQPTKSLSHLCRGLCSYRTESGES